MTMPSANEARNHPVSVLADIYIKLDVAIDDSHEFEGIEGRLPLIARALAAIISRLSDDPDMGTVTVQGVTAGIVGAEGTEAAWGP